MNVFEIGTNELIVAALLALIILGPERLVRLARDFGRLARTARSYLASFSQGLNAELDLLDDLN